LTGPHPEWEEDSFRDGCIWDNYLEENGSEWELCKKIAVWLASGNDASTSQSPDSFLIILMTSIGIIAIAALIVKLGRK
ncbi:MAG: hypothetical protein ACXAAK_12830, partial [Candidatus Thorarchaeota archaeon]